MEQGTTTELEALAEANLKKHVGNAYPGRGVIAGVSRSGRLVLATFLTGRSPPSKNRAYDREGGRVFTRIVNPSELKPEEAANLDNLLYNAMVEHQGGPVQRYGTFVAGNGKQTDTVLQALSHAGDFRDAMRRHTYELPDGTPRITASITPGRKRLVEMSIIRKIGGMDPPERQITEFEEVPVGFGWCLVTYNGVGGTDPYQGSPFIVPLAAQGKALASRFWNTLNRDKRVAVAVKEIDPKTGESEIFIADPRTNT